MCWAIEKRKRRGERAQRRDRPGAGWRRQQRLAQESARLDARPQGDRVGWAQRGQATVEAAFALPVLLVLVLMLLQPAILLYDRMVMANAAAEGARFLSTGQAGSQEVEDFVRRRLGAVPPQDLFHCHDGGCSWQVESTGGEASEEAYVRIRNELKPLPLIDYGANLLGLTNGAGRFEVEVEVVAPTQPSWAFGSSLGMDPQGWVTARDE